MLESHPIWKHLEERKRGDTARKGLFCSGDGEKKKALSQHLREGYGGFSVSKQVIERTGTNPGPLRAATAMGTQ